MVLNAITIPSFPIADSRFPGSARGSRAGFGSLAETPAYGNHAKTLELPFAAFRLKTARRGRRAEHASGVRSPIR